MMFFESTDCKNKKIERGFTLIEMLVAVAIISLLATIGVTASMAARDRAQNSRIQAELSQVRIQANVIKNDTASFVDFCDSNDTLNDAYFNLDAIERDVRARSGHEVDCFAGLNPSGEDEYCAQAQLLPTGSYCVDSSGYAGTDLTNCDSINKDCN